MYAILCRYEGRIVQQMIINDGGQGEYTEVTPPMLGIWDTVLAVGSTPPPFYSFSHAKPLQCCLLASATIHQDVFLTFLAEPGWVETGR